MYQKYVSDIYWNYGFKVFSKFFVATYTDELIGHMTNDNYQLPDDINYRVDGVNINSYDYGYNITVYGTICSSFTLIDPEHVRQNIGLI